MDINDIAKYVDRTNLKADATREDIIKLCDEAKKAGNASVCVNSYYTALVSNQLSDCDVSTCVVVGFPLGSMSTKSKAYEAACAVEDGADEIDMVINIGALKDKKYNIVEEDIYQVVENAKPAIVKVIIEACMLTDDEKLKACELALKAGAAFVKTSTGFGKGGATIHDVALMRKAVGDKAGVKAAGGIRTTEVAEQMISAGANRIGASNIQ